MLRKLDPKYLEGENLNNFRPHLDELVKTLDGEATAEQILTAIRNDVIALAGWYGPSPDGEGMILGCYLIIEFEKNDLIGNAMIVSGVVGDTFGDYEPFHEACVIAAKQLGCKRLKFKGRRGLWRMYKPLGYREAYTVYAFDIED